MANGYEAGYNAGFTAAQGGGQPQQQQGGGMARGLGSLAVTAVFAGRSLSDSFRTRTDAIGQAGLGLAGKATGRAADVTGAFAKNAEAAGKSFGGMTRATELVSKSLRMASNSLTNMARSVPLLSKGFERIGSGTTQAFLGLFTKGNLAVKVKAVALGLKEVALGMVAVARGALIAMPALGPILVVILALVAAFKLIQYTVRLFKDEIKEMKDKALEPWGHAFEKVGDALKQVLAPAVALTMLAITAFWKIIEVVGKEAGPIIDKMADGMVKAFEMVEKTITFVIETVLHVAQYFLNQIVSWINFIKVAFAIFSSDKGLGEKVKLFARAVGAFILEMVKHVIELLTQLNHASAKIVAALVNAILVPIEWLAKKWVETWRHMANAILELMLKMVDPLAGIIAAALNAIFRLINNAIDGVNKVSFGLIKMGRIGDVTAEQIMGSFTAVKVGINAAADAAIKFIDGIKINPDDLTAPFDYMKNKALEALKVLEDKFGLNMKDIAAEVGVDLLNAPDLVGSFQKLLAQAKIKIADDQLNKRLDKLGETIDKVNDKDVKIEINPLIQIHISGVDDPTEVRRIALEAVDEGLAKAGAQIAIDANAGEM